MTADARTLARATPAGLAWYHGKFDEPDPETGQTSMWMPARHLMMVSRKICDAAAHGGRRLMIFMPPRHGKSELVSRYTPPWYLGNFPERKVMLCSYADSFAASWGRKARDVFDDVGPELWDLRVDQGSAGGQMWQVAGRNGVMTTAGVGGAITGKGADLLIIDDPVKNAKDAQSEIIREDHHDWWKSTARTRLMPQASVILLMTRWHEDDLAGRLLKDMMDEDADQWEVISIPGLATEECTATYPNSKTMKLGPDPLGRKPGEALWPEQFDVDALNATLKAMGSYWFNSMYQQTPRDAEGNLFKKANFRYFERVDDGTGQLVRLFRNDEVETFDVAYGRKFQTVDCAESEKKEADFSVVATWIVTVNKDLLLWEVEAVKFNPANLKPFVRRKYFEHRPAFVVIEKKSTGTAILSELINEGLPCVPTTPDVDKVTRAIPAVARYEEARVFHDMHSTVQREEYEPQLLAFPNAAHDDFVDVVSMAAQQLPLIGGFVPLDEGSQVVRTGGDTIAGGLMTQEF